MNKLLALYKENFDFSDVKLPVSTDAPIDVNNQNLKIGEIVSVILPYVFGAAGIALLVFLIIGGLQMMLSRGDPKAMQSAQAKITNALIGFVIIIIAFFVVQLIGQLLGINQTGFGVIFSQ
jgi:hypothetical protein